jgi:hypothetical protein
MILDSNCIQNWVNYCISRCALVQTWLHFKKKTAQQFKPFFVIKNNFMAYSCSVLYSDNRPNDRAINKIGISKGPYAIN